MVVAEPNRARPKLDPRKFKNSIKSNLSTFILVVITFGSNVIPIKESESRTIEFCPFRENVAVLLQGTGQFEGVKPPARPSNTRLVSNLFWTMVKLDTLCLFFSVQKGKNTLRQRFFDKGIILLLMFFFGRNVE